MNIVLRVIRASKYRRMRWKNGQGETAEIAIAPVGATVETFDWRISTARVETDGPFSTFDGVDRTLAVLEGSLVLAVDGGPGVALSPATPPFTFPGDAAAAASLGEAPVLDLNVMTRRDRRWHRMSRIEAPGEAPVDSSADLVLFARAPGVRVQIGPAMIELDRYDSLFAPPGQSHIGLAAIKPPGLLLIEIGTRTSAR